MSDTLVVVGCVLSLGLIAVSAFLNFRMGFRSADSEIDGWAYGLAAAMGDGLKALAPFVMHWGWRRRDGLAVIAAAVVFVVISAYSLTAALGFAELHRGAKQAERQAHIERHQSLRKDITRTEARLAQLGLQRSESEVDKAIAAVLAGLSADRIRTVDQVSKGCTLNRMDTRTACAEVARLAEERERSREQSRLLQDLRDTRRKLAEAESTTSAVSVDPQVDALARAAAMVGRAVDREGVQFGLSLLVALLVELGGGLGVYISTTPWRGNADEGRVTGRRRSHRGLALRTWTSLADGKGRAPAASNVGGIDHYAMERLMPREDGDLRIDDAFADYVAWCGRRGLESRNRLAFRVDLAELAGEVGIPIRGRGDGMECVGVALVDG